MRERVKSVAGNLVWPPPAVQERYCVAVALVVHLNAFGGDVSGFQLVQYEFHERYVPTNDSDKFRKRPQQAENVTLMDNYHLCNYISGDIYQLYSPAAARRFDIPP